MPPEVKVYSLYQSFPNCGSLRYRSAKNMPVLKNIKKKQFLNLHVTVNKLVISGYDF